MEFPKTLTADETTRAGRMLAAGDVRVTVTDVRSGEHITVRFKAYGDNRERTFSDKAKNWIRVPLVEATHIFIEVPNASGEWSDKIGTFYPKNGRFFKDTQADPERVQAAIIAGHWLNDDTFVIDERPLRGRQDCQEESRCGRCGRELTDPVSIDRGIGPECFGKETGSQHQVKNGSSPDLIDTLKKGARRSGAVLDVLEALSEMSDDERATVKQELEMWHSQERHSTLFD